MKEKNIKHGKMAGIALLFSMMIVLSSFSASATAPETRQESELILRVAMQDDAKGMNPLVVSDVWSWNILRYLFDGPINVNQATDELIPYIAVGSAPNSDKTEGWTWEDCTVGTFDFNPKDTWGVGNNFGEAVIFYDFENVKWHDGTQMSIRDILFSMHMTAQVPEWSYSMNVLKDLGGKTGTSFPQTSFLYAFPVWESADGLQAAVKFELQDAYAGFFRDTISTFLIPYHIWGSKVAGQNVDNAKLWYDAGYDLNSQDSWKVSAALAYDNIPPIGNGPFKFDLWNKGSMCKVTTFRDHFFGPDYKYSEYVQHAGESLAVLPNIDGILYRIYKTAEAAVLALKSDDIDYIAWSIPPSFVQELSNEPGVALMQSPEQGFFYLSYNMRLPSFGYDDKKEDVAKPLRQAIAHCIDKNRIVTRLLLNLGISGDGPVSSISTWYNNTIPRYNFEPDYAKEILANAGYKVRTSAGDLEGDAAKAAAGPNNWWINPDGSNIGGSPGGKIEILTPEANYDPIRAQAGLMIAQQLRDIGIYAESVSMDFGSIVDRIDNRDFEMYILGWSIGSDPTDFLWAFFHSNNNLVGQNYPGYQNATFDDVIDAARRSPDEDERKKLVMDAQASICYDLPYDVLYYRTNIEAYRSERFTGWEVGPAGSIFNWNSLMNIRAPSPFKTIAQFASPPSAMVSNATTTISVLVKDQDGNPLSGANVLLNASIGSLSAEEGVTGSNGRFDVTFHAPYADPNDPEIVANGTQAIIQISAATYTSSEGTKYDAAPSRLTLIRVYPEGASFLSVKMSVDPDVIDPDITEDGTLSFAFVEVVVTNENGDPVSGSTVALKISPEVPTITPEEQLTDADGKATFQVTATDLPDDDDSIKEYVLTAIALHPDDANIQGENMINLNIVDKNYKIDDPGTPFPSVLVIASVLCVASVSYAVIRRKKQ